MLASSLHITSLIYTQSPLKFPFRVTKFLTPFQKVSSLQGKEASKPAANWFQLLMLLFTDEYVPTSVVS
jgi:hypothetical protein